MSLMPIQEFYDSLAGLYDEMTAFEQRFEKETPAFRHLVERFSIRSALDAGCGSGFHSVLLVQLGVAVTALDLSPEMVRLAKANGQKYGFSLNVQVGSFANAHSFLEERCDAAFVMGNSLPHLLTRRELLHAMEGIVRSLRSGGLLFIQCLNYERILTTRSHLQGTRSSGNHVFERSYEYESDHLLFSIVTRSKNAEEHRQTIRLRPILREELQSVLEHLGLTNIEFFGTISLSPFDPLVSPDLVTLARKS